MEPLVLVHANTRPRQSAGFISRGLPLVKLTFRQMKPSLSINGVYESYKGANKEQRKWKDSKLNPVNVIIACSSPDVYRRRHALL